MFVDVSLFLSCALQGSKVQTRVGLLMLLCTWINNCPIAVTHFLHNQENVPFVSLKLLYNNFRLYSAWNVLQKQPSESEWMRTWYSTSGLKWVGGVWQQLLLIESLTRCLLQLTAQISENLGEDERLVQGLCALLLGICIYYNDNSLENYTK